MRAQNPGKPALAARELEHAPNREQNTAGASPGRRAYEEDVRRQPTYHDGAPRVGWDQLDDVARRSWERNPTPRDWPATRAA